MDLNCLYTSPVHLNLDPVVAISYSLPFIVWSRLSEKNRCMQEEDRGGQIWGCCRCRNWPPSERIGSGNGERTFAYGWA